MSISDWSSDVCSSDLHRGHFRITQSRDRTYGASDREGKHHARPRLLRSLRRQYENAGSDYRTDSQHGQLKSAQRAIQRLSLCGGQNCVSRLYAAKYHAHPSVLQYLPGLTLPGRRLSPQSSCASILQMLAKEKSAREPANSEESRAGEASVSTDR